LKQIAERGDASCDQCVAGHAVSCVRQVRLDVRRRDAGGPGDGIVVVGAPESVFRDDGALASLVPAPPKLMSTRAPLMLFCVTLPP